MINENTRLEIIAITANSYAINAMVTGQTILNILVSKGITTQEEINKVVGEVKELPEMKKMIEANSTAEKRILEVYRAETIVSKQLAGEEISQEDQDFLDEFEQKYME